MSDHRIPCTHSAREQTCQFSPSLACARTNKSPDFRACLELLGLDVGDYQIPEFRKPGQYVVIPMLVFYELPEHLHQLPVRLVADHIFRIRKPIELMSMLTHSVSKTRLDGGVMDLRNGDLMNIEMTSKWLRFYLKPEVTCGHEREALANQEPVGWRMIERAVAQAKKAVR